MALVAVLATVLLGAITVFQIALALGAPLGRAAWGGRHKGALPYRLRIASGVAGVVIYPLIIAVVLFASGLIGDGWSGEAATAVVWVLSGVFGLGAVLNAVSRSPLERVWAPVSAGVAVCCALVALQL